MERYIRFVVRHRLAVVLASLAVTSFFASQLRHLHMEIRRRANLPDEHPYVQVQNRMSDLFGGEGVIIIGVLARNGTIYDPATLGKVYRITQRLLDVPSVIDSSVFSIAAPNARAVVAGDDGAVDIHPLMDEVPRGEEDVQRIRAEIRQDHLFRGNLVSQDETATAIVADFDAGLSDTELAEILHEIVAPERDQSVDIAMAGSPILRAALARYTSLIAVLFPLAVVVIGLVHWEAFRTLQAMLLPLVTALLSVVWALGLMGWLRQPMDSWSALTPVLILAVAAGHAVQILKRYYEEYAVVGDNKEAVVRAVTAVGPVMLTAGAVASAGFASLMTFGVQSVKLFGLLLSSGIISALIIEMPFTPACRSMLRPPRRREVLRERQTGWLDRALERIADVVARRPVAVLVGAAALVVVSAAGALRLEVDNSIRFWFAPSTEVRRDDALLNEKLSGTATLRVLIEGDQPHALERPDILAAVGDLADFLASDPYIGGVTSIAMHVKRIHQAMHDGDPAFYRIPDDAATVGEYLFLYDMAAGPDGLIAFIDSANQRTMVRALSKTDTAAFSRDLIARTQRFADERFRGLPVEVGIAGGTLGVQTALNDVVVAEKIANIAQVSLIIFLLCAFLLRSFVGGLFVLVPLAVAVIFNFGVMGWTHTWLDMTTATITAMGISIGADFALYLIARVREERQRGLALDEAVRVGLRTSGKAIFFVSSAVAVGYLVLPLSGFSIWVRLGILTALIVSVSALATLLIIPALALTFQPRFLGGKEPVER